MKINVMGLIESVKHEKETREAELVTTKNEVEVPVENKPAQVNPEIPAAVPTTQGKSVDYNRADLFLPNIPKESAKTPEPQTPSIPLATPTDIREQLKPLPSPRQLDSAYKWLCSFDSAFRVHGRCKPPRKCQFMVDRLDDEKRKEYEERGNLRWRDWNFLYDDLQRVTIANKPVMTL